MLAYMRASYRSSSGINVMQECTNMQDDDDDDDDRSNDLDESDSESKKE